MIKLYGTLGPACCQISILQELFAQGMTGVRLNLSHGGLAGCGEWVDNLFTAAASCGVSTELIIDMQGPELRVGALTAPIALPESGCVRLGAEGIPVPPCIFPGLDAGQEILLDDGAILIEVTAAFKDYALCRVVRGGTLKPRKSIALPGRALHPPTMTQADLENLSLAKEYGVTGVMQPFVRSGEELRQVRRALQEAGVGEIKLFAKLENREGVAALAQLLPEADEIVIARGDLGNAMPLWELPGVQKDIAAICRQAGKAFMVATQMLYTMERAAVPTRAEVSDIFNAVLDGASSLILTGETAAGQYPVEAMRYLCLTAREACRYKANA